jgi:hypothetical protein
LGISRDEGQDGQIDRQDDPGQAQHNSELT